MPTRIFSLLKMRSNNLDEILKHIEQAETICLFRHILPDGDAIGSQMGLKKALQDLYPDKKIYALGHQTTQHQIMDEVDDAIIKDSLAIILDSSNSERVDDNRFRLAKDSIRIDHHVPVEEFCALEWIKPEASATCEMLGELLNHKDAEISKDAAQLLYQGLVSDNIRFTIKSVSPKTFEAAAYLVSQGADVVECEIHNYSGTMDDFRYETRVKEKANFVDGFLYSVMEQEDFLRCALPFEKAKEKVFALSGISDAKVWALFTRMDDGIHYCASLRSRRLVVREIACQFGGGGHDQASGIKNLTASQVYQVIDALRKLANNS